MYVRQVRYVDYIVIQLCDYVCSPTCTCTSVHTSADETNKVCSSQSASRRDADNAHEADRHIQ